MRVTSIIKIIEITFRKITTHFYLVWFVIGLRINKIFNFWDILYTFYIYVLYIFRKNNSQIVLGGLTITIGPSKYSIINWRRSLYQSEHG